MRNWLRGGLIALGCVLSAGCAEQAAQLGPGEAVALVRSGQPVLRCREACLARWRTSQPQAAQFEASARWPELAQLLIGVGYEDDLSLYYLGRAAEGLRSGAAAIGYYRLSAALSNTALACRNFSRLCGGVSLPRAASLRLAALEREQRRPPRRAAPPLREAAPEQPDEAAPAAPSQVEARPPQPQPLPPPTPPAMPESDYIEPPPATR